MNRVWILLGLLGLIGCRRAPSNECEQGLPGYVMVGMYCTGICRPDIPGCFSDGAAPDGFAWVDTGIAAIDADSATVDASDAGDVATDAPIDASDSCPDGSCRPSPPRLIAPISTSRVTSRRPTLRWAASDGEFEVQMCRDRAMTERCATSTASAASFRPSALLDEGVWFWRVRAQREGVRSEWSFVWQFWAPARDSDVDSTNGFYLDVNGDGRIDVAAADGRRVLVFLGGRITSAPQVIDSPTGALRFSDAIAAAGDLNGDGFGDLAASSADAFFMMPTGFFGAVWTCHGSASGTVIVASEVRATVASSQFGVAVAGAGDVDQDGYGDLWVTENPWIDGGDGVASVKLFRSSESGLRPTPSREVTSDSASRDRFGERLCGAVDFNGDGRVDLVVGRSQTADAITGRLIVFTSSSSGDGWQRSSVSTADVPMAVPWPTFGRALRCGDLDADGFADVATRTERQVIFLPGSRTGLRTNAVAPEVVSAGVSEALAILPPELSASPRDRVLVAGLSPDGMTESFIEFWGFSREGSSLPNWSRHSDGFSFDSIVGVDDEDGDLRKDTVVALTIAAAPRLVLVGARGGMQELAVPSGFGVRLVRLVAR
jgi:hypothetical protein